MEASVTTPARMSPTALAALASELRIACMRISRRVRFESDSAVPPHQFSVLMRLQEQPRTPRELADLEQVSAPSMTRTTTALVDQGLAQRTPDPTDGRSVILSLTPDGIRTTKATRRERDRWMHDRLRTLTPREQETLARAAEILHRVAAR